MTKAKLTIAIAALAMPAGALAAACEPAATDTLCLAAVDVSPEQKPAFEAAGKAAINALASPELEQDYKAFTATHIVDGPQQEAWKGVDIDAVLKNVREAIGTLGVTTYGGVGGWFKKTFQSDTGEDVPVGNLIRLNRWALPQPVPSLAKTITRAAAYKAGLTSPSANPSIAACEPVNVVASLVEKQIVGEGWKRGPDDCQTVGR